MPDEAPRSREARAAAEQALVRVVHHYGARPEFVVLGGLVPELLCSGGALQHAGTTDVDVQVNLEIACGAVNTVRLEHALLNAEFQPDSDNIWRWRTDGSESRAVVKLNFWPTWIAPPRKLPSSSKNATDWVLRICVAQVTRREMSR